MILDEFLVAVILYRDVYEDQSHRQYELIHFLTFLNQKKLISVSSHKMCFEKFYLEYSKDRVHLCEKGHCELFLNHVKSFVLVDREAWVTLTLNHDVGTFYWYMEKQPKDSQGLDGIE